MTTDIQKVKNILDALSDEDRDEVRRYLDKKRFYNKNYSDVAVKVQAHIVKHGHITNKEAFDRGYTSKLLDTTTFHRCIISKLTIEIGKKRLMDRRIAFYDVSRGVPSRFDKIDNELVGDILSNIDFRKKENDLMPLLDGEKYPILKRRGSLKKLRPLLVRAMADNGYEVVGSRLDFVRGR
tara:strand:+ start:18565 stop:19107 length:543 start_codon:yes stop_codon:yes gene_type:complete